MKPRRSWGLLPGVLVVILFVAAAASGPVLEGCVDTTTWSDAGGPPVDDSAIDDSGGNSLAGLESITIDPADAKLEITGTSPVTKTYKALGKFKDGKTRDVTDRTEFSVEHSRVGIFLGAVFTSAVNWGGSTTITAKTASGVEGKTSLTVLLKRRFTATGVASTVEQSFGKAADDTATPVTLAYPPDGALVPPNLVDLEIQWTPGAAQDTFEVSFTNAGTDIRVFTKCTAIGKSSNCGYVPDAAVWKIVTLALKGDEGADVMVRGMGSDTSKAGKSNTRKLLVAEEDIKGGLYYWNAMPGAIIRYDFGQTGQKAKLFYNAAQAKAIFCVGCHAMSLNGKRMAVGLDMPAPAPLQILDVASRTILAKGAANFMAFDPEGDLIITSDGNSLVLRDAATLVAIPPTPLRASGTMADWSADGTKVVYAKPATALPIPVGSPGISKGSLELMLYDATAKKFSSSKVLVAQSGSENNYYPTFSPDNELIIFNRSSGESYDADDATLWALKSDGKSKPMELKNANGAGSGSNCNSWPKFSPFIQKYKGGKLLWVTFSSRRDYGLRLQAASGARGQAQLWMAAIDLAKDEMLTDPSYPAFWLPFQNIATGNHIAQWTKEVVKKPCGLDGDCPTGETCVKNLCEPK